MIAAVAGVLAIGSELLVVGGLKEHSIPVAAMALAAITLGGRETLRKGFQALRARRLTMNLLMSVAAIGACGDRSMVRSSGGHLVVRNC